LYHPQHSWIEKQEDYWSASSDTERTVSYVSDKDFFESVAMRMWQGNEEDSISRFVSDAPPLENKIIVYALVDDMILRVVAYDLISRPSINKQTDLYLTWHLPTSLSIADLLLHEARAEYCAVLSISVEKGQRALFLPGASKPCRYGVLLDKNILLHVTAVAKKRKFKFVQDGATKTVSSMSITAWSEKASRQ
jgi:hypothetical protein